MPTGTLSSNTWRRWSIFRQIRTEGMLSECSTFATRRSIRSFRFEKHRARLISEVFSRWSRTYDLTYIGGSRGRVFRGDSSYDNADVAANAAVALPGGVVRDAALAGVMANVVGRDDALAERLFSGLGSSRYRAWSAARGRALGRIGRFGGVPATSGDREHPGERGSRSWHRGSVAS